MVAVLVSVPTVSPSETTTSSVILTRTRTEPWLPAVRLPSVQVRTSVPVSQSNDSAPQSESSPSKSTNAQPEGSSSVMVTSASTRLPESSTAVLHQLIV